MPTGRFDGSFWSVMLSTQSTSRKFLSFLKILVNFAVLTKPKCTRNLGRRFFLNFFSECLRYDTRPLQEPILREKSYIREPLALPKFLSNSCNFPVLGNAGQRQAGSCAGSTKLLETGVWCMGRLWRYNPRFGVASRPSKSGIDKKFLSFSCHFHEFLPENCHHSVLRGPTHPGSLLFCTTMHADHETTKVLTCATTTTPIDSTKQQP